MNISAWFSHVRFYLYRKCTKALYHTCVPLTSCDVCFSNASLLQCALRWKTQRSHLALVLVPLGKISSGNISIVCLAKHKFTQRHSCSHISCRPVHTLTHTNTHTNTHTHTQTHTLTSTHTCTHREKCAHTHTHTNTQTCTITHTLHQYVFMTQVLCVRCEQSDEIESNLSHMKCIVKSAVCWALFYTNVSGCCV